MSYKKTINDTILPAIARMTKAEEDHLKLLEMVKSHTDMFLRICGYKEEGQTALQTAIDQSKKFLEHLKQRQQEYTEFAEKLK